MNDIEEALAALRRGAPVLVLDDEDRENEGDAIVAAQTVTAEWVGWMVRHGSGLICAPLTDSRADELELPLMVSRNADSYGTAYTVTVDAAEGVTTGISADDRLRTLQVLANGASTPADLTRPGHTIPLRARAGGVLERPGHTEAGVDLTRLAGLAPIAGIVELVDDAGRMLRADGIHAIGKQHDLPVITIADLITWRQRYDRVEHIVDTALPTRYGTFTVAGYRDRVTDDEIVALVSPHGVSSPGQPPLVRLHSECLTGDAFGSWRCDCGPQLDAALERLSLEPGVVVYLRGHEGRGVGLLDKLRAYREQDNGLDTVDAQTALGLPVDAREFHAGTAVLHDLGITALRLLTNNPAKIAAVRDAGIDVAEVVGLEVGVTDANADYLRAKAQRLGHQLSVMALGSAS